MRVRIRTEFTDLLTDDKIINVYEILNDLFSRKKLASFLSLHLFYCKSDPEIDFKYFFVLNDTKSK